MIFSRLSTLLQWFAISFLIVVALMLPRWLLLLRYSSSIHTPENAPALPVAIVFGAGLRRDGRPTTVLADRVLTAVDLYKQGKIDQILMSGSIRTGYDEPKAMGALAEQMGVQGDDILIDAEGDRSYQTCLRAKQVYGIEEALVVSQRYHLPRVLAICDAIGVQADGVAANRRFYRAQFFWLLREIPATYRALWDTFLMSSNTANISPNGNSDGPTRGGMDGS